MVVLGMGRFLMSEVPCRPRFVLCCVRIRVSLPILPPALPRPGVISSVVLSRPGVVLSRPGVVLSDASLGFLPGGGGGGAFSSPLVQGYLTYKKPHPP